MIFALLGWIVFQPDPAIAKIYKYKDDSGKTHFTDDPSRIPLQYRNKGSVKKFKGVNEPTPAPGAPPGFPGKKSAGAGESGSEEEAGLSAKDEGLVKKTIQVFKVGIALGKRYKNVQPNYSNGQRAVNTIQSALPLKKNLISELVGTRVPELQAASTFLNQSIAVDEQTKSIGAGLKARIVGIFNRLEREGQQQAAMIDRLQRALDKSKQEKLAAAKKKNEEVKK